MADAETTWLTVTEIARRLHLPASTVRNWRNDNRDLLKERTDERGHFTYSLAVFMEIERLHRQGRSVPDVRAVLAGAASECPPEDVQSALLAEVRALHETVRAIARHLGAEVGEQGGTAT